MPDWCLVLLHLKPLVFGAVTFKAMEWVADWCLMWNDALGYTSFANEVKGHLIRPFCPHACVRYVHTKCSFAATYCATVYVYICVCLAVHQRTTYWGF